MAAVKITEIKVTMGRDVFIMTPAGCTLIVAGKAQEVPAKLAATLFKAVAAPAEKFCNELRAYKG